MSHNVEPIRFDRGVSVRTFLRPLMTYIDDPAVTEIAVVRPGSLYTREQGQWVFHPCEALSLAHLQALTNALTVYNGLGAAPILSVMLPDGERGQIIQPPAILDGCIALNVRKHAQVIKTLEELNAEGAFDLAVESLTQRDEDGLTSTDRHLKNLLTSGKTAAFLDAAVQERCNIVVAGAAGSGKTTFARSLIDRVNPVERIITIEDVHELELPHHANVVHMMYGNTPGRVDATQCIAACMRLSPDRIFLAELRGGEAWEYLTALNTGHPGSITTTHSNSAVDTYNRLAMLVKQSPTGGQLDLHTIQQFLRNTVDIIVYFERFKLREIYFEPLKKTIE